MALDSTILVEQVPGDLHQLQQTVKIQCSQRLPPVAVAVADRGNPPLHQVWTMEELAVEVVPVVAEALIPETVLTVDSVITVGGALTVKVSPEVRVLDLMQTLKILTKVAGVAVLAALAQVLLTAVSVIVHLLEAIKLPEALEQQLIS